jgi:hypothetical protein
MSRFDRLVNHLVAYFNLSNAEARRLIAEFSNGILIACVMDGSVSLPHLGEFKLNEDGDLELTSNNFACTYLKNAKVKTPEYPKAEHRSSQPDKVRQSLFYYLNNNYSAGQDWEHPGGCTYTYQQVGTALDIIRQTNSDYYDILYARILTKQRRDSIAAIYRYSEATIKRRCDAALSSLLLLLVHPELESTSITQLYQNN